MPTTDLTHPDVVAAPTTFFVPSTPPTFEGKLRMAEILAKSALIPMQLRGKPNDVLIVMLTSEELGIGYMLGLRSIFVLDGKPSLSADLLAALILRSPICEEFRVIESTATRCQIRTKRRGQEPVVVEFTIEDARTASLLSKTNWRLYPRAMLRARCITSAARTAFADIAAGLFTEDELSGEGIAERMPESTSATPPPSSTTVDVVRVAIDETIAHYRMDIAGATTVEQLKAIAAKLGREPESAKAELRTAYAMRMEDLAQEMRSEREPGDDREEDADPGPCVAEGPTGLCAHPNGHAGLHSFEPKPRAAGKRTPKEAAP